MRLLTLTFILFVFQSSVAVADDKQTLSALLNNFLTGQTKEHHQNFWADELIYTSSNGTRFGKAEIMAGFKDQPADPKPDPSGVKYSADNIDIRLHGDYAIVAFKLVAKQEGEIIQTYWNTGTFKNFDGRWQAIAWQATKIPVEKK